MRDHKEYTLRAKVAALNVIVDGLELAGYCTKDAEKIGGYLVLFPTTPEELYAIPRRKNGEPTVIRLQKEL